MQYVVVPGRGLTNEERYENWVSSLPCCPTEKHLTTLEVYTSGRGRNDSERKMKIAGFVTEVSFLQ